VASYLHTPSIAEQDGVINLPILLALSAASLPTGVDLGNPSRIDALRTHYSFDPEWFDEAFNQTIARLLADGIIQ